MEDFPDDGQLQCRLERGRLYNAVQVHLDAPNPQQQDDDVDDDDPLTRLPQVNVDYLDWYVPEADPKVSRPQTIAAERERLRVLRSYRIVPALAEEERDGDGERQNVTLDRLATLARRLFDCKMSFVSILDLGRCLFLARDGLPMDVREVPRRPTFCSHALVSASDFYEVRDARDHPVFRSFPMVRAGAVRYYAAQPLVTPEGYRLGCFTVVDDRPRPEGMSARDAETLRTLADQAVDDLVRHRDLRRTRQRLSDTARTVASLSHDLVTPLSGIQLSLDLLLRQQPQQQDNDDGHDADSRRESLETAASCAREMQRTCQRLRATLHGGDDEDEDEEGGGGGDNHDDEDEDTRRERCAASAAAAATTTTTAGPPPPWRDRKRPAPPDPEKIIDSRTASTNGNATIASKRIKHTNTTTTPRASPYRDPDPVRREGGGDDVIIDNPSAAPQQQEQEPRTTRHEEGRRRRTALVVEDCTVVRKMLARALRGWGWHVSEASDGRVGLARLRARMYDVCFMDFLMPVMDGFDCCRALRAWEEEEAKTTRHRRRRQYVVGMSAHASPKDVEQSRILGMDDFAPKPITVKVLQGILERVVVSEETAETTTAAEASSPAGRSHEEALSEVPSPEHSCLLIGFDGSHVTSIRRQLERASPAWSLVVAPSSASGASSLRSRHWSVVLVDNACFAANNDDHDYRYNDDDDHGVLSGAEFLQRFRAWEQANRIHLQRNVYLCGSALSTSLSGPSDSHDNNTTTTTTCVQTMMGGLPSGVDGTLSKPVTGHDLTAVLRAAAQTRLGREVITRF